MLESADAPGGPSPGLLHSLRSQGCKLVLACFEEASDAGGPEKTSALRSAAALSREWFDAVFDKVLDVPAQEEDQPIGTLCRYLTDVGIQPQEVLCYSCSEVGTKAFAAAGAGLILAPDHSKVWAMDEENQVHVAGADIAALKSPSARQLSWLYKVMALERWCVSIWLAPPPGELHSSRGIPADAPPSADRAVLTSVAGTSMTAQGHPPWVRREDCNDESVPPVCTALLDGVMVPCPDWTPMEPRLRSGRDEWHLTRDFARVTLYSHSLDVGVAQVNHAVEVEDASGRIRMRNTSRRFVNGARMGQAATEISVTVSEYPGAKMPDIVVRSSLCCSRLPTGFSLVAKPKCEVYGDRAVVSASIGDASGRIMTVTAWHRFLKDDGRGDVLLKLCSTEGSRVRIETPRPGSRGSHADGSSIDLVFPNVRRGTRYTVEKVVSISYSSGAPTGLANGLLACTASPSAGPLLPHIDSEPGLLPEIEEEHRSAWRTEWDRADVEIEGTRKTAQCQRMLRLFRYHQVSRGYTSGSRSVPEVVRNLFSRAMVDLCGDSAMGTRPSALITSRVIVHDPRDPPVMRIDPKMPPACQFLRFNVALGWRWHRFTLTQGKVRILVQGPILNKTTAQLHGDTVKVPPSFTIPSSDGNEQVMVKASPWHEVQVQHALTDLGRPDGSAGGFYSLMRRTRFIRAEIVKRLLTDSEGDYKDSTLQLPLRNALAGLQSVPRPPSWDDKFGNPDLHILRADAATRVPALLAYEKGELMKDIRFVEGEFYEAAGQLAGETVKEVRDCSVDEAKTLCRSIPDCVGFTFQRDPSSLQTGMVYFKRRTKENEDGPGTLSRLESEDRLSDKLEREKSGSGIDAPVHRPTLSNWVSYRYEEGEAALLTLLQDLHETRFEGKTTWYKPEVPSWSEIIRHIIDDVLHEAARAGEIGPDGQRRSKPFQNFITDRDGTTNNYCDRYASSVQSAYNAAWLSHFARHCTENAVFITAAPLGGRPSAEGLMELSVAPRGTFIYSGSKGREYFDHGVQRVLETEELPSHQRDLIEELHRRILQLCSQPGNSKFLGIGSGLQRKFGEVTMARNDPALSVPEPESKRFLASVRKVKEDLDPDGLELDLHDTGTDMEIFPRSVNGRASFDKGCGLRALDRKLKLHVVDGPNLVCGDTSSDVAMIEAALRLLCGDSMVDVWLERLRQEEPKRSNDSLPEIPEETANTLTEEEEAERKEKLQREEAEARVAASKLAVIFVIAPDAHERDMRNRNLAERVLNLCQMAGAPCGIVPSPDLLVGALAQYASEQSGRRVTDPPPPPEIAPEDVSFSLPEAD
eukprot:TRINITY_DN3779_c0_g2_i2.p1 TRINITY_DN3779_c0_g2~~TRINITY_DN3779_c0_g2_i2.p1  ORF type:complete len:1370 (-),score=247.02 TRINITY_DN3779_c0_g2_i2:56-4006(-)